MFDGSTYSSDLDKKRLAGQLERVHALMSDGGWRTLRDIAAVVGSSEAGVSARLRDFRKKRFAALFRVAAMESRRVSGGLWEYRIVCLPKDISFAPPDYDHYAHYYPDDYY